MNHQSHNSAIENLASPNLKSSRLSRLSGKLPDFLETTRQNQDSPLPVHVRREVEAYLDCGILANGFIRVRCESCRHEKFVAFSCRRQGQKET